MLLRKLEEMDPNDLLEQMNELQRRLKQEDIDTDEEVPEEVPEDKEFDAPEESIPVFSGVDTSNRMQKRPQSPSFILAESKKLKRGSISDKFDDPHSGSTLQSHNQSLPSTSRSIPPQLQNNGWKRTNLNSRDPRLSNKQASSSLSHVQPFFNGDVHVEDLIRSLPISKTEPNSLKIQENSRRTDAALNLLKEPQSSFYANVTSTTGPPTKQRSPLISSNHNAVFLSQATTGNVRDVLDAKPYQNLSLPIQAVATRVGADLNKLSLAMNPPVHNKPTGISFADNTRTCSTQTDDSCIRIFKEKAMQTTKNTGGFSITIDDLSILTDAQRNALAEFKKAMKQKDDQTTSGILERMDHRNANRVRKESIQSGSRQMSHSRVGDHQDRNFRLESPARAREMQNFCNPPAPDAPRTTPRYSNFTPK